MSENKNNTATQDILYNFAVLFTHSQSVEEKEKILTSASLKASLSKKDTYEILSNERRKIQHLYTKEMAELALRDNDAFIEKYKIKEKIPQDQLPCIFGIDIFGRVSYTHKNINDLPYSTKNLKFISKIDKDYKCVGFRA
jgi:hypothetical protein